MRKFLRFSREIVADCSNLTPEQYEVLLAIKACSTSTGLTVGELSERLQVKHHTAVSVLDKLMKRKLVVRQRTGPDRRHVHVKLTGKGTSVLAHLAEIHRREIRRRSAEMIEVLRRLQT
jgi:DNA-binding MarR family transcriptional regulator